MNLKVLSFGILGFILASCSVNYQYVYHTAIKQVNSDTLLKSFEDETLSIKLYPKPNGIYFDVTNKTSENMYLLWNQCYFIEPDGNSSRALNTDLLETHQKIATKESYISILPKYGNLRRFTASSKNVSSFREIYTVISSMEGYSEQSSTYSQSYLYSNYWKVKDQVDYSTGSDLPRINANQASYAKSYAEEHNKLGLGLAFKKGNDTLEYDFRLPIVAIDVYNDYNSAKEMRRVESVEIVPNYRMIQTLDSNSIANEALVNKIKVCEGCGKVKSTITNDFAIGDVALLDNARQARPVFGVVVEIKDDIITIETFPAPGNSTLQSYSFKQLYKIHHNE